MGHFKVGQPIFHRHSTWYFIRPFEMRQFANQFEWRLPFSFLFYSVFNEIARDGTARNETAYFDPRLIRDFIDVVRDETVRVGTVFFSFALCSIFQRSRWDSLVFDSFFCYFALKSVTKFGLDRSRLNNKSWDKK